MNLIDTIKAAALRLFGKPALTNVTRASYGSIDSGRGGDNDDPTLAEYGNGWEGIALYARIRRQVPRISGFFGLRADAGLALPHTWFAGDPNDGESRRLRDEYESAWDQLPDNMAAIRSIIVSAIADGIGFGECVYFPVETAVPRGSRNLRLVSNDSGQTFSPETLIVPRIIDQRPEFFQFDADRRLRFRRNGGDDDLIVDPRQIIIARAGSAQLWGRGVMSHIAPDAWKFIEIEKMGLAALKKQGYPLLKIIVPEGGDADRANAYIYAVSKHYPNYIVVPSGDRFDTELMDKDASPTFIGADQLQRQDWLIDSMSIDILGVKFSNNTTGSFARDQVAQSLLFDKVKPDAGIYDHIANNWRDKVAEINHPTTDRRLLPFMETDTKPTEDLKAWADNLAIVVDRGFPASVNQIAEKQGFQIATDAADRLKGKPVPVLAPPPQPGALPVPPPSVHPADAGLVVMSEEGDEVVIPWARFAEVVREMEADA